MPALGQGLSGEYPAVSITTSPVGWLVGARGRQKWEGNGKIWPSRETEMVAASAALAYALSLAGKRDMNLLNSLPTQ